MEQNYENALKVLSLLHSNRSCIIVNSEKNKGVKNKLSNTKDFLNYTGISLKDLDKLSIIHIAGTKGKGTTCAFTESILRHHGLKTGFFSSPHLISVRERIKINAKNISKSKFTKYFWQVFNNLKKNNPYLDNIPSYFQFMTILMFYTFLEEHVDVAIVEVGIGGEYDYTNVIPNPLCVGITSLALEHQSILGNTIEDITIQKSGIFKYKTQAFTVPHEDNIINLLKERAHNKKCNLSIVKDFKSYMLNEYIDFKNREKKIFYYINKSNNELLYNVSLSLELSSYWLKTKNIIIETKSIIEGLLTCDWAGRMHIVNYKTIRFFFDGAHTIESIAQCVYWYNNNKDTEKNHKEILVFNTTGNRNSEQFLNFIKTHTRFIKSCFIPNAGGTNTFEDVLNSRNDKNSILKCKRNCEIWGSDSEYYENFSKFLDTYIEKGDLFSVLVTGSLHLVGAGLTVLKHRSKIDRF